MTHYELLDKITNRAELEDCWMALQKVVELHRPEEIKLLSGEVEDTYCFECEGLTNYPCPTIQVIEKELR